MTASRLYDQCTYYDIAFQDIWDHELTIIKQVLTDHVAHSVESILEPACGTGRALIGLSRQGFTIMGYDKSAEMVRFARERVAAAGLQDVARAIEGDMATVCFNEKYDLALNLINSIGYLHSDADIIAHFKNTAESLRDGSVYLVHLGCAPEKLSPESSSTWTDEKNGVRVTTSWSITRLDYESKLSIEKCSMEIDDNGKAVHFEEEHHLRLWLYDDLKRLISDSNCFRLEAIYDEKSRSVDLNGPITGEHGNLYYVLKVIR
jgi:SAM-dependent methyltransferase